MRCSCDNPINRRLSRENFRFLDRLSWSGVVPEESRDYYILPSGRGWRPLKNIRCVGWMKLRWSMQIRAPTGEDSSQRVVAIWCPNYWSLGKEIPIRDRGNEWQGSLVEVPMIRQPLRIQLLSKQELGWWSLVRRSVRFSGSSRFSGTSVPQHS